MNEWSRFPEKGVLTGIFLNNDPKIRDQARDLVESKKLKIEELRDGLYIETYSYVGKIKLGDIQIVIHPKIEDIGSGQLFFNLLRYAYGLRDLRLFSHPSYQIRKNGFQDLLISQLALEVRELLLRGLYRKYVRSSEDLCSPKGRIDFHKIVHQGMRATVGMPCIHYPRLDDCLINQVLLEGLYLGFHLTEDAFLKSDLYRLINLIQDNVSYIKLCHDTLRRLDREVSRLTKSYESSINIIKLLYNSQGVILDNGDEIELNGFLFDMNRFFQALIYRFISENLVDYSVRDEYPLKEMIVYSSEFNPKNHISMTPRPDYVILKSSKIYAILDAKYRDLWERNLPRNMLYQLGVYALGWEEGKRATILYPTVNNDAREQRIEIHGINYGENLANVVLRPVNIIKLADIIDNSHGNGKIIDEREKYAQWLVFGEK